MGLNAFFAYTIVLQDKVPWPTALGIVFWAGVLFLLISATPLRERIATAIPATLRLRFCRRCSPSRCSPGRWATRSRPRSSSTCWARSVRACSRRSSILFTDLFDSLSTFIGVATAAGLTEPDGRPLNLRRGLIVDAFATFVAGLAGTSAGTAYVESIAGIRMGGRTWLASVVTALCFLPCFFVAPLAASVPTYATAPVLVLVGVAISVPSPIRCGPCGSGSTRPTLHSFERCEPHRSDRLVADDARRLDRPRDDFSRRRADHDYLVLRRRDGPGRELRIGGAGAGHG